MKLQTTPSRSASFKPPADINDSVYPYLSNIAHGPSITVLTGANIDRGSQASRTEHVALVYPKMDGGDATRCCASPERTSGPEAMC